MSRMHTARLASAIVPLALALAACGSSGAGQAGQVTAQDAAATATATATAMTVEATGSAVDVPPADVDPMGDLCALVPAATAATALAEPVDAGTSKGSATFDNASCRYLATGSASSLTVWYHPVVTRDEWTASMTKTGMADQRPVDGIGDAAYLRLEAAGGDETKLAVYASGHTVWVIVASPADPLARAAAAESIARLVLGAVA